MSFISSLLFLTPRMAFRRATIRRLTSSRLVNERVQVWQRTAKLQAELRKTRPRHSFGVNHFLRYMEWDHALYQAVQEHGMPEAEAGQLIEEINWEVFGTGTKVTFMLSRLRSPKLQTRVQWVLDLLFFALFTKPFRQQAVSSDQGIAFHVVRCPVAEYFEQQGIPELTRYAACNLDYRMAQNWGVNLERTQTIATGAAYCDFRFKIPATAKARAQ